MKDFLQFTFRFLYVRNWHTGTKELSRSRLLIFGSCLFLVVVALVLIGYLQAPLEVSTNTP